MNKIATYNETIIVATLMIATNYFFVAICTNFLQRKRLLYTTEHICGDIDGLLQPSNKELQYHLSIATKINLPATQIKSWQH
jgi:hypothetical protein